MYSLLRQLLDQEQAKLITLMLVTMPLSFIMGKLQNKYLIFALSFASSFIFQSIMFPTEKYFLWAQQQIVYLLLVFCPRKIVGKIILLESFLFLAFVQLRRMYIAYAVNGIDITGILMMQIFLYIGIGYNYQHGALPQNQLTQSANQRKIVNLPNYLTYMGYVFFLPSSLVGPTFEFRDYQDYLNREGDYKQIPSPIMAAVKELGVFLLTLVIYLGTQKFQLFYILTQQYNEQSLIYKLVYIGLAIFHIQFKYISAWSLGLISVNLSGFSYSKASGKFDKIQITRIYNFFFNPSIKIKAQCWNIPIQIALKRYIYDNIYDQKGTYHNEKQKKKVQGQAQMTTLMTSAFWHGLYPGYFVSFFHWTLYLRITQQIYRLRQKIPLLQQWYKKLRIDFVQSFISDYALVYFGVFFHIMTLEHIKFVILTTYGLPFILLYINYLLIVQMKILSKCEKFFKTKQVKND